MKKQAYPIILSKGKDYIVVFVPDFNINTQGSDFAEAIEMARDAIGIVGIDMQDENEPIPEPSNIKDIIPDDENDIVTLVDIDFNAYRKKNDLKAVRRNVTLPNWLNQEAEKSGINVSAVLQEALKQKLNV
ncbi:MAG: type II toxin-antitoxin system HicB family antitoxin [Acutalibacteraceae bacterium]